MAGRILTLTTDWLQNDYYNGILRGKLISLCPDINIIEISNQIPLFNSNHAAFVLRHSFKHFPQGTIHLVLVNSENSTKKRMLAFEHFNQFFVIPDNGMIGLLFREMPTKVFSYPFETLTSFSSLEASAKVIENLYNQNGLDEKRIVNDFEQMIPLRATIEDSVITGGIIYVDSYYNIITNVSSELFERVGQGKRFEIFVQSHYNKVNQLVKTYNEVEDGELLALFNSAGLLEIAINNGHAAQLLNLSVGGSIRIKFHEEII